jgi:ABC-type transport system substrate-binding protein
MRNVRRESIGLVGLVVAVIGLSLGCGRGNFSEKASQGSAQTLRVALHTQPTTMDPARVQDVDTGGVLDHVYEGLVAYTPENVIGPGLAAEWSLDEAGTTYTFRLREAKFHNGKPVTAADVKSSLERHLSSKVGSPTAANYLADIVGAREVAEGKATDLAGVKVLNDRTLTIQIDARKPFFLGKLTYPCAFVLPNGGPATEILRIEDAIGTGPFRVERWIPQQEVVLRANPDYHGGAPRLASISRPVILDAAARMNKFRAGELDLLSLERQDIAGVERDPQLKGQLQRLPRPAVYYVSMNQAAYPPFRDARVRRAFAMAVDRRSIAEKTVGLPFAAGLVPPGIPGHREGLAGIPFDPNAARRLLAEAGYAGGAQLPPLAMFYRDGRPDSELLAVSIIGDLKKNLGVDVQARSLEWGAFLERRNKNELPMFGGSWYGDYLDPENFLSFLFASTSKQNYDALRDPMVDALARQADRMPDGPARWAEYAALEDRILELAPRMPVYFGQDFLMVSPRVKRLRSNVMALLPHTTTTVDDTP